ILIGNPGLRAVHHPALIIDKKFIEARHALRTARVQRLQIVLEQIALTGAALIDRQRANREISEIAERTALAHQLPVEPQALAVRQHIGIALMTIAEIETVRISLRALPFDELVVSALKAGQIIQKRFWQ